MLRSALLTTLMALSPLALADVEFVSPAGGASIPAGQVTITWKDSGTAPLIKDLTTYTIQLMVGGNDDSAVRPLRKQGTGLRLLNLAGYVLLG
jgi:hypothetical protein